MEGIFRLSGSEKRIKELKQAFDSADRYGKGLVWDGYTVHDAANVLRRYLNDLPEPVVPLDLYERFREPLRSKTQPATGDLDGPQFVEGFDIQDAIVRYQQLITELPPLNRQLLLYILDLLAVFAAKADENRMTANNLAAIFQPGMLSHPNHSMVPEAYRLNQTVIIFLIENQDHFLIGMQGTAADEKTVEEVQKGTPVVNAPDTPVRKPGVTRSSSNASAGAESVAREGQVRRNRSVSSRHSRQSGGAPSPGGSTLTTTPSSGLGRSNTVPSKKSPAVRSGRVDSSPDQPPSPLAPLTPVTQGPSTTTPHLQEMMAPVEEQASTGPFVHPAVLTPGHGGPGRSQEKLLEPLAEMGSPARERRLPNLFQRLPGSEVDGRQPNKLRKKRIPSSANPSAQSSTTSLPHSAAASPTVEAPNPLESPMEHPMENAAGTQAQFAITTSQIPSDPTPRAVQVPPPTPAHPAAASGDNNTLRPRSPPTSLHSSANEASDVEHMDETAAGPAEPEKEKKRRWRISRRKEDMTSAADAAGGLTSPRKMPGANANADMSSSSLGSGPSKPRRSFAADSSDPTLAGAEAPPTADLASKEGREGKDAREEVKGPIGWIKNKVRDIKDNSEQRRNKSPPPAPSSLSAGSLDAGARGKSFEVKRPADEEKQPPQSAAADVPQPQ